MAPNSAPGPDPLARTLILKHMFSPDELVTDPAAVLDIKEDIRDECTRLLHLQGAGGDQVTNVVVYDLEPDGVVGVKFREAAAARICGKAMDGRMFAGLRVEAVVSRGKEGFRKSAKGEEEEGEEEERLKGFGEWLEKDGGGDGDAE